MIALALEAHDFGEVGELDLVGLGHHDQALDDVFEFADITWPVVSSKGFKDFRGELDFASEFGTKALGKTLGKEEDIVAAIAQRGKTMLITLIRK